MTKQSTLDPDDLPGQDAPKQPKGHDIRSLGPSNSSDTGADMAGPGLIDDDALALDRGTNEDTQLAPHTAQRELLRSRPCHVRPGILAPP